MKRMIVLFCVVFLVCGCATQESRARLAQIEDEIHRTQVEIQSAELETDTGRVLELEKELAMLRGAATEAGRQVSRERESSLVSSMRNIGGVAAALAPLLGYVLPGAAGTLQVLAGLLSRRRETTQ